MSKILKDAGSLYLDPFINPKAGHQDSLIGTTRYATFDQIGQFLDATIPQNPKKADIEYCAYPPWIGPILTEEWSEIDPSGTPELILRIGSLPSHRAAEGVVMLRVQAVGDDILRPDGGDWDEQYIVNHMVFYWSNRLRNDRWDAFEAPLPSSMPGNDPSHPGNAMLVLLVYAEDGALVTEKDRLYAFVSNNDVFDFEPFMPKRRVAAKSGLKTKENVLDIGKFKRMARAVYNALELARPDPKSNSKSNRASPSLKYRGASPQPIFKVDPALKMIVEDTAEAMNFGQDAAVGQATLERLIESDRDLMDGIVPYDPPRAPPAGPLPGGTSFSFASCQYPGGFFDAPVAYRSYGRIVERFERSQGVKPRFMLFVGDQVYVDPSAGLYDPTRTDDRYRLPYETWLRQRPVRDTLRRVPSFMLLDDHEIGDNWEPVSTPDEEGNSDTLKAGVAAYEKYQRGRKPNLEAFQFDGFHFFMLDTRTGRSHRKIGSLSGAHLFSPATMIRLKDWLLNATGPKFVVSPLMLLPRHRRAIQRDERLDPANLSSLHSDAWDGYPDSLREVLVHIAENQIRNVVFLSGDEHRGCVASVKLFDAAGTLRTSLYSIHTSAMYAPYPFANSIDDEIVTSETIEIAHNLGNYRCVVEATRPPAGDGATFLFVRQVDMDWKLDVEFANDAVQTYTL